MKKIFLLGFIILIVINSFSFFVLNFEKTRELKEKENKLFYGLLLAVDYQDNDIDIFPLYSLLKNQSNVVDMSNWREYLVFLEKAYSYSVKMAEYYFKKNDNTNCQEYLDLANLLYFAGYFYGVDIDGKEDTTTRFQKENIDRLSNINNKTIINRLGRNYYHELEIHMEKHEKNFIDDVEIIYFVNNIQLNDPEIKDKMKTIYYKILNESNFVFNRHYNKKSIDIILRFFIIRALYYKNENNEQLANQSISSAKKIYTLRAVRSLGLYNDSILPFYKILPYAKKLRENYQKYFNYKNIGKLRDEKIFRQILEDIEKRNDNETL